MVAHHNLCRPDLKVIWAHKSQVPPQFSQGPHFVFPEFIQVDCRASEPFFISSRAKDMRGSKSQVDIPVYLKTILRQSCRNRPL